MITLLKTHFNQLKQEAEAAYPHECCGGILGLKDNKNHIVKKLIPIENTSTENKTRRFAVSDINYLKLESCADKEGLSLLGFYHSHPDHPAVPSQTDLNFAWPEFSYIIIRVNQGLSSSCFSYRLDKPIVDSTKLNKQHKLFINENLLIN